MPNLRQILDKKTMIQIHAYGTPEGVSKAWDTRGRGQKSAEAASTPEEHRDAANYHRSKEGQLESKANARDNSHGFQDEEDRRKTDFLRTAAMYHGTAADSHKSASDWHPESSKSATQEDMSGYARHDSEMARLMEDGGHNGSWYSREVENRD